LSAIIVGVDFLSHITLVLLTVNWSTCAISCQEPKFVPILTIRRHIVICKFVVRMKCRIVHYMVSEMLDSAPCCEHMVHYSIFHSDN